MIRISGAKLNEKLLIRKVERACFKEVGQENFFVVDLTVVDGETIRELNNSARGVDKVTDVLSFPCFDKLSLPVGENKFNACDYDGKRVMLGSIMICRQRAQEQAEEFGHSYARELGFLTCHGLLHLLGFDHIEKDDEEIMTAHQREVMKITKLLR
ncbi:MAG: rRNA maturation RNase YbeY [Clostridia bacterium]|nr:rRNA maturation RNase YbeY [Clostridia bacterium]